MYYCIYFEFQSAFMSDQNHHLDTLQDIKQIMERSSRFISLSGLSGIAAGSCALVGAWFANDRITAYKLETGPDFHADRGEYIFKDAAGLLFNQLFVIALVTFAAAFTLAFIFTYLRSRKTSTPIWGTTARRLMISVIVPMATGGIFLLALIKNGVYEFTAPGCLVFYGLAVLNASKYTFSETVYLSYSLLLLGIINLWFTEYSIYFWALGFGVFHIIYGTAMWWKHER